MPLPTRLNVEMPDDAGRDGFVEFLGSPTIVVQVAVMTIFATARLFLAALAALCLILGRTDW